MGRWSLNSTDTACAPGNDVCDTTGNESHGDFFGSPTYVNAGLVELAVCSYTNEPADDLVRRQRQLFHGGSMRRPRGLCRHGRSRRVRGYERLHDRQLHARRSVGGTGHRLRQLSRISAGSVTDTDACTVDICTAASTGATTLVHIEGNDVTVTCDPLTALTYDGVNSVSTGSPPTAISWTHVYTPPVLQIHSATLTMDAGDLDSGTIELRAADGTSLGTIAGADNGGPGPFVCPDQWDLGIGNDNVLPIPSSLHADLADGRFLRRGGFGTWRILGQQPRETDALPGGLCGVHEHAGRLRRFQPMYGRQLRRRCPDASTIPSPAAAWWTVIAATAMPARSIRVNPRTRRRSPSTAQAQATTSTSAIPAARTPAPMIR